MACLATGLVPSPNVAQSNPDLVFINVNCPTQTSVPDIQKLVRSHATYNHHYRDRDPSWEPSWSSKNTQHLPVEFTIVRERPEERVQKAGKSTRAGCKRRTSRFDGTGRRSSVISPVRTGSSGSASNSGSSSRGTSLTTTGRRASAPTITTRSPPRRGNPYVATTSRGHESKPSSEPAKKTAVKLRNPADALDVLARTLAIDMSNVLCYYHYLIDVCTTDLEIEKIVAHDLERKWLDPMTLSNPMLLSSITLLTTSHLRFLKREPHNSASLLKLRGLVLENIQAAIRASEKSVADAVVLSIVIMAAYEAFYGTRESHRVHVQGLTQIMKLRGGSVEHGYMDRLLLQFDASVLLGTRSGAKA